MAQPIIIVGAGIFGSVLARRLAEDFGQQVTIIERRPHPGGNCWSEVDKDTGIEVHKYGSHIFHTSDARAWDYISHFTAWNGYRHHVWSRHKGRLYPLPISLATVNSYYGLDLDPSQMRDFLAAEAAREGIVEPRNLEEKAISQIGRPLYEAFIRGYTLKQWQKDPCELSAEIINRLPVRTNYDTRYFSDTWEGIPLDGYGALFGRLLDHPRISLRLGTDWRDVRDSVAPESLVIYSGPIDEFYDYRLGRLEWRGLDFEWERHDAPDYQGTSVINSADESDAFTRTHEFRHYHPERPYGDKTVICREYSRWAGPEDEPYYPVNTEANRKLYAQYEELAGGEKNVLFGGRLGAYRYLDMDKCIGRALEAADALGERLT